MVAMAKQYPLFILKALVVLIILWAGAYGGTLTPSFALGWLELVSCA